MAVTGRGLKRVRQSVAVIGSGISGMTAAHVLQQQFDVTVFEANARLGGNAHTYLVNGAVPIDLGFVAYNEVTYPYVARLFGELGIKSNPSLQSADAVCADCQFSHLGSDTLGADGLPPRPPDASEAVWRTFAADRDRFGTQLGALIDTPGTGLTVDEFLIQNAYSHYFIRHYLLPRLGPWFLLNPTDLARMPMRMLADTMGPLMTPESSSAWRVVKGGSHTYIDLVARGLTRVLTSTPVRSVTRTGTGVDVRAASGTVRAFDKAVIAVHPPQALRMLDRPSDTERELLGAFEYARVEVALHTDASVLPDRCTGGLMMHLTCATPHPMFADCHVDSTQALYLETATRYIKSFNATDTVDPAKLITREFYEIPVFTRDSLAAQERLAELSGSRLAWAGAYHGNGFHEAGCRSGVAAAEALGAEWN